MLEIRAELDEIEEYRSLKLLGLSDVLGRGAMSVPDMAPHRIAAAAAPPSPPSTRWSHTGADDVTEWLRRIDMARYTAALLAEGFDTLDLVATMTPADLADAGVHAGDAREVILPALETLRARNGGAPGVADLLPVLAASRAASRRPSPAARSSRAARARGARSATVTLAAAAALGVENAPPAQRTAGARTIASAKAQGSGERASDAPG